MGFLYYIYISIEYQGYNFTLISLLLQHTHVFHTMFFFKYFLNFNFEWMIWTTRSNFFYLLYAPFTTIPCPMLATLENEVITNLILSIFAASVSCPHPTHFLFWPSLYLTLFLQVTYACWPLACFSPMISTTNKNPPALVQSRITMCAALFPARMLTCMKWRRKLNENQRYRTSLKGQIHLFYKRWPLFQGGKIWC